MLIKQKGQIKVAILGLLANLVDSDQLMRVVFAERGAATIFMAMLKESGTEK